ncbi:MAG: ATP-binding protein [Planctomycetes bacterium]|nr:ATP-binding protein [Planctomycetota bacterium]
MEEPWDITLRIVSHPRYLAIVRAAVESFGLKVGLSEDEAAKVTLAVDEAMANVIRHGYHGETGHPIWLKMTPTQHNGKPALKMVVEDECRGVDATCIKPKPRDPNRPGGLGVAIIKEVMDEMEYETRTDGSGISLSMLKYVTPAKTAGKE